MSGIYSAIREEFEGELSSLRELVGTNQHVSQLARTRVASVRAATLLLAATFEEFVRQMALERASSVVSHAISIQDVPNKLLETAWKQTLAEIVRTKFEGEAKKGGLAAAAKEVRPKFDAVCKFVEGDLTQSVLESVVRNENNMRPGEINRLFSVSGITDICLKVCDRSSLKAYFDESEPGKTHGALINGLNRFIDKRNHIAHTPNSTSSDAPEEVLRDIEMLGAFSEDLDETLSSLRG